MKIILLLIFINIISVHSLSDKEIYKNKCETDFGGVFRVYGSKNVYLCFKSDCPQIGESGCVADCCFSVVTNNGPYCDTTHPPDASCKWKKTDEPTTSPTIKAPTPYPTFTVCDSNVPLDIAFLIDESGSISDSSFLTMKTFIERLTTFDINDVSFVRLIGYSDSVEEILPFTAVAGGGRQTIINAVKANQQRKSSTNTGQAIRATLQSFDLHQENSKSFTGVLFVLTDGMPGDSVCPLSVSANVEIVLIGIGSGVSYDKLISSTFNCLYDDEASDVFHISTFDAASFNALEAKFRDKLCLQYIDRHRASIGYPDLDSDYGRNVANEVVDNSNNYKWWLSNVFLIICITLIFNLFAYCLVGFCCQSSAKKYNYVEDNKEDIQFIDA